MKVVQWFTAQCRSLIDHIGTSATEQRRLNSCLACYFACSVNLQPATGAEVSDTIKPNGDKSCWRATEGNSHVRCSANSSHSESWRTKIRTLPDIVPGNYSLDAVMLRFEGSQASKAVRLVVFINKLRTHASVPTRGSAAVALFHSRRTQRHDSNCLRSFLLKERFLLKTPSTTGVSDFDLV